MKTIPFLIFCMVCTSVFSQNTKPEFNKYFHLKLKVLDAENGESLEGTYLKIYTRNKPVRVDSSIVKNGFAVFKLQKGNDYDIVGQFDEYLTSRANFNAACYLLDPSKTFCVSGIVIESVSKLTNQSNLVEASMTMKRINLHDIFRIDNIHYDFDKWQIRKDAFQGLNNLIQILRDNPNIMVELGSHTDSRADEEYNMALSQKRAEEAVNFIIINGGITKARIIAKGYGETQLLNQCKDGVVCSEKEHATNRRTEIKVLGYKSTKNPTKLERGSAISGAKN